MKGWLRKIMPITTLFEAVERGTEEDVRRVLRNERQKGMINARGDFDGESMTALSATAYGGKEAIVSLLLDQGADIDIVGSYYGTALGAAAYVGKMATVSLLLDRGADINIVGGCYGTALGAAAYGGEKAIVSLLLDRGADINIVGGSYGTALGAAAYHGKKAIVSLLLDRGADINIVGGDYGTALGAAVYRGNETIVSLLLDRGADTNIVGGQFGSALGAAAFRGNETIVSLLLDRGADINIVGGNYGNALGAAAGAYHGNKAVVSLLLDRGADINIVGGDYGSALGAAACREKEEIVSLLLDRGADINIVGGRYGSALGAAAFSGNEAIVSLLLDRGADINIVGGYYGSALGAAATAYRGKKAMVLLLLDRGADINIVGGKYGSALGTAALHGNEAIVSLLLDRGADINIIGGNYGTALGAAAYGGQEEIVSLLLDRGADINIVGGDYGTALGVAAYHGKEAIVSLLLDSGADVIHVGGFYETAQGEYPTALDAAQSHGAKASTSLLALVDSWVKKALKKSMDESTRLNNNIAGQPPFPMPYTHSTLSTYHHFKQNDKAASLCNFTDPPFPIVFRAGEPITSAQADFLCKKLNEEALISLLISLVGIHDTAAKRLQGWIKNDIRYFISQNFDFGLAYAAARAGWKHFNEEVNIAVQRGRWLKKEKEIDVERIQAIHTDSAGQELIKEPYSVMPRRIWDLKSNRVIEYRMLHSEVQSIKIPSNAMNTRAPFWAVTHSWTQKMKKVETSINQYQWPVPLPEEIEVYSLRTELLDFGAEYIWLDAMCLRQQSTTDNLLEIIRQDEWKLDVPTIGNIYHAAEGLVRYFNGLGKPFSCENWDDSRHWLQRAWTLQEIGSEAMTFNGGTSQYKRRVFLNTQGKFKGELITLRRAMQPIIELASQVGTPSGCSVYQLAREMANRVATNPTDKVAGLFYLLRAKVLPIYDETVSEEFAWKRCFHVLPFKKKLEILFDFPSRGTAQQWFPTWKQLMEWPQRNPDYKHHPTEWPEVPETTNDGARLFIPDARAISGVLHASEENEYILKSSDKDFVFYGPYLSQMPIAVSDQHEFTLVVLTVADFSNFVVCKEVGTKEEPRKCNNGTEKWMKVVYLEKVGVLRTDHDAIRGVIFKEINCLFV